MEDGTFDIILRVAKAIVLSGLTFVAAWLLEAGVQHALLIAILPTVLALFGILQRVTAGLVVLGFVVGIVWSLLGDANRASLRATLGGAVGTEPAGAPAAPEPVAPPAAPAPAPAQP
ncbi:hypothetical protein [Methylobrevis albus]|uniref:Uncharacterized protein n=1 Tax=Methylobrevis albus TaxID=2793297 RepID=A0A931MZD8_9HYPH|nr:hypothetical protein [Methylobrevis albus]MBH0237641.1 hypothetical protein [Methylobrevis albus]